MVYPFEKQVLDLKKDLHLILGEPWHYHDFVEHDMDLMFYSSETPACIEGSRYQFYASVDIPEWLEVKMKAFFLEVLSYYKEKGVRVC